MPYKIHTSQLSIKFLKCYLATIKSIFFPIVHQSIGNMTKMRPDRFGGVAGFFIFSQYLLIGYFRLGYIR